MTDYTSDEILAATTKLVREAIRRPYGALGNRATSATFSDTQDAAAGLFLVVDNAVFYTVKLGTQRLVEQVLLEEGIIVSLLEAITSIDRRVQSITSLSSLSNASVALGALTSATENRTSIFNEIEDIPAYQRFANNVQKFLDTSSQNIKSGGSIVSTPEQARTAIPGLVSSLKTAHAELIRRVTTLGNALDDYNALDLPSTLSASIIANAKTVLDANIELLEGKSPEARLEDIRDVTLDLLAARSVIRRFGSLAGPTTFAIIDGSGGPFADGTHGARPAELPAQVYGPYAIFGGSAQLDFFIDGDSSITTTVQLQGSFVARLDGTIPEPFDIGPTGFPDGTANDKFSVQVTGSPVVSLTFSTDAAKSIEDVVSEINTAISLVAPPPPIIAEAAFNFVQFTGSVDALLGPDRFKSINPVTVFDDLVDVGDKVVVVSGTNEGNIYTIVSFPASDEIEVAIITGAHVAATDDVIEIGAPDRFLRIRITTAVEFTALEQNFEISLPQDVTDLALTQGYLTLGLVELMVSTSRRTTVDELITGIDQSPLSAIGGVTRVEGESEFTALHFTGQGRTVSTTSLKYVLFKLRATATVVETLNGTTLINVVGAATAGVEVGDVVVLREASVPADINAFATVVSVTDTQVTAVFLPAVTDTTDVLIEIGPDLAATIPNDAILRIGVGSVNEGDYRVTFSGSVYPFDIPFEIPLERPVVQTAEGGFLPIIDNVELGQFRIKFKSTDVTLSSTMQITDGDVGSGPNIQTAYPRFFTSTPAATGVSVVGATTFFQLPEFPKTVEVDDLLELYEQTYNVVSQSFLIESTEAENKLIILVSEIDSDLGPFSFTSDGAPPPFARVRNIRQNNFSTFETTTNTWLELDENEDQFFRILDGLINPLISNTNPTLSQVNSAKIHVQQLHGVLTTVGAASIGEPIDSTIEAILDAYEAKVIPQVDMMVDSFIERGSDRAVDILLEGQFSTFFGLDIDEVSYAGDVLKKIRAVQREDLPIRKVRREENLTNQTLLASYSEPDFEFSRDDIEGGGDDVNLPGEFALPFPGSSF